MWWVTGSGCELKKKDLLQNLTKHINLCYD